MCKLNLPLRLKGDSHHHDHVNFSRPWINTTSIPMNITLDVHGSQSLGNARCKIPILMQNGVEVCENVLLLWILAY
jgi:hypothetical protein